MYNSTRVDEERKCSTIPGITKKASIGERGGGALMIMRSARHVPPDLSYEKEEAGEVGETK